MRVTDVELGEGDNVERLLLSEEFDLFNFSLAVLLLRVVELEQRGVVLANKRVVFVRFQCVAQVFRIRVSVLLQEGRNHLGSLQLLCPLFGGLVRARLALGARLAGLLKLLFLQLNL